MGDRQKNGKSELLNSYTLKPLNLIKKGDRHC